MSSLAVWIEYISAVDYDTCFTSKNCPTHTHLLALGSPGTFTAECTFEVVSLRVFDHSNYISAGMVNIELRVFDHSNYISAGMIKIGI